MAARRRRAAADDSQLSLDFLFGGNPDTEPVAEAAGTDQGAGDEPLRSPGDAALAEPSADPVHTDHGPRDVLTELGEQVETEVEELTFQLAGDDPPPTPGEPASFLDKAARINTAKRMAEERVLAELVLLPAETEPETGSERAPTPA
jgi:hypothetical protein